MKKLKTAKLKGMSLVEVVVALSIFTIMSLMVITASIFVLNTNTRTTLMGKKINYQAPRAENGYRHLMEERANRDYDPDAADAEGAPANDPRRFKYLDVDGNPTNDPSEAAKYDTATVTFNGDIIEFDDDNNPLPILPGTGDIEVRIYRVPKQEGDNTPGQFKFFASDLE